MSGVNKAIILGFLGSDPELRYLQSGQPVCKLSIATSRRFTNKDNEQIEETEWHRVSVWGKQAEHCNNYLAKGRQVYVEGRLRTSSYDKDGHKHYTTEIVADTVQFIGGAGDKGAGGGEKGGASLKANQKRVGAKADRASNEPKREAGVDFEEKEEPIDDVPF